MHVELKNKLPVHIGMVCHYVLKQRNASHTKINQKDRENLLP